MTDSDNQHTPTPTTGPEPSLNAEPALPSRVQARRRRQTPKRVIRDVLLFIPVFVLVLWLLFRPTTPDTDPTASSEAPTSAHSASSTADHNPSGPQSGERTLRGSGGQSGSNAQSAGIETAFDHLEVSGRVGATPVVTLKKPISLAGAKERVYEQGTGRIINHGQPVLLAITAFDGDSGQLLNASGRPKLHVGYATEEHFASELLGAVIGHSEGSRVVMVRRLKSDNLAPTATSAFEIDVVDILPSIATGTEQPDTNGKPLTVTIGETGPRIDHSGEPPQNLTTQLLAKGDGPQVQQGDKVVAQYIMTRWSDGVVRQSTWDDGIPQLIDLSTAMPGLVQALTDQRVGSRIAITIPPDLATGEDTMTIVVDILGTSAGKPGPSAHTGN